MNIPQLPPDIEREINSYLPTWDDITYKQVRISPIYAKTIIQYPNGFTDVDVDVYEHIFKDEPYIFKIERGILLEQEQQLHYGGYYDYLILAYIGNKSLETRYCEYITSLNWEDLPDYLKMK